MTLRAKYRTVPNTPASIKQHEDQGFEVCGYSEYSADGFPSKAEMRKYVRVPDFHRDADGKWSCHTCGGVGICSCISGTNDPICDCGQLAFACKCREENSDRVEG